MTSVPRDPLTVTVLAYREKPGGKEVAVSVELAAGDAHEHRILTVRTADFGRLGIRKGPIDQATYDDLEHTAQVLGATHCGARLLVYSPNTCRSLVLKIMRHGYTREESVAAVEWLNAQGLIDEDSYLEAEVARCLKKLWGEIRIREKLYTCGFGADAMARVPELLAPVDFIANCCRVIDREFGGLPEDGEELRRLHRVLRRYGYSGNEIYVALREMRLEK